MPEVDEKVMRFVEEALDEDPDIQLEDLFRRAIEFKESMGELSRRQFNARYPLQVKRRRALAARDRRTPRRAGASKSVSSPESMAPAPGPREAMRRVFLQFAADITAAEDRKDLVRVLADIDRYVEEALTSAERG